MSTPYLAEIRIFSFNFAPKGWALCNGQLLAINQNQALFSILGTTYGGNGISTFALPNLQGRVPIHTGNGFTLGQNGGEVIHTITVSEMPAHSHLPMASVAAATQGSPAANIWGAGNDAYAPVPNVSMNAASLLNTSGGQPHDNMSPYLTVNYCIALVGIFPSQN